MIKTSSMMRRLTAFYGVEEVTLRLPQLTRASYYHLVLVSVYRQENPRMTLAQALHRSACSRTSNKHPFVASSSHHSAGVTIPPHRIPTWSLSTSTSRSIPTFPSSPSPAFAARLPFLGPGAGSVHLARSISLYL